MNQANQGKNTVRSLVFGGVFLAAALLLPFLTGQIPQIGSRLAPMHIPALLCGFVCGPLYGLLVGFAAPLLRSVVFGMPPMFPTAVAMAFELGAYGLLAGVTYRLFPKKLPYVYLSLVLSMTLGRLVWGVVMAVLMAASGGVFGWELFVAGAFTNAVPGIILHIVAIPPLMLALQKAKLMDR